MKQSVIDTLITMGATRWEKNGADRLYLNDVAEKAIGLEYTSYKNGGISSATLKGETIANAAAARIYGAAHKAYIDLTTGEIVVPRLNEKYGYTNETVASEIAAFITALEEEEEAAAATETAEATETVETATETTYTVEYQSGESRMHPGTGIDYMLVDCDGTELYAEMEPDPDDEKGTEDALKAEIIEQAIANGIAPESLAF